MELAGPPQGVQSPAEPPQGEEMRPNMEQEASEKHEEAAGSLAEDRTQGGEGNVGGMTLQGTLPSSNPPRLGGVLRAMGFRPQFVYFYFYFFFCFTPSGDTAFSRQPDVEVAPGVVEITDFERVRFRKNSPSPAGH